MHCSENLVKGVCGPVTGNQFIVSSDHLVVVIFARITWSNFRTRVIRTVRSSSKEVMATTCLNTDVCSFTGMSVCNFDCVVWGN
jgi:hypothetical protein